MLKQFTYFGLSGLAGTAAHFAVLTLLVECGWMSALPATCIGAVVGAVVTYLMNYRFTFKSSRSHRSAASRYAVVVLNGWVWNAALMAILLKNLSWHYLLLQAIVTTIVMMMNFILSRQFAFREDNSSAQ